MNALTGIWFCEMDDLAALKLTHQRLFFMEIGGDYTIYPFATTNAVDYRNLQGVYMDATFHPLLQELDYKQEGWRLEHDDLTGNIHVYWFISDMQPLNWHWPLYSFIRMNRYLKPNELQRCCLQWNERKDCKWNMGVGDFGSVPCVQGLMIRNFFVLFVLFSRTLVISSTSNLNKPCTQGQHMKMLVVAIRHLLLIWPMTTYWTSTRHITILLMQNFIHTVRTKNYI